MLPYTTDFESAEGYQVGALTTDAHWQVETGSPEITDLDSASGQQSLFFTLVDTPHVIEASFTGQQGSIVFVDLYLKPEAGEVGDLPMGPFMGRSAQTGFIRIDGQGEVIAMHGDGIGEGDWVYTGERYALIDGTSANWHRFTYRLNYLTKTWDLYLDEQLVLADLGFLDSSLLSFTSFRLSTDGQANLGIDFFYAGEVNPLFADLDLDGIPDDYEAANHMDVSVDDRYGDRDLDSLINLDEYMAGTSAGDPDTDDDGVHDGAEAALGADPLIADAYLLSVLPFADSFESHALGALTSLNNWSVVGAELPMVSADDSVDGSQVLLIDAQEEELTLRNAFRGDDYTTVWVDFYLLAKPWPDVPELKVTTTAAFYFSNDGQLMVYDGWGAGAGEWIASDDVAVDFSQWRRLTVRLDYENQAWDVWLDGLREHQGLGFANSAPYFSEFSLRSGTSGQSGLDRMNVVYVEPLELDNDGDGLFNELEDVNRDGVVDAGETNAEAFDTDEDGMGDGVELLYGFDPTTSDSSVAKLVDDGQGVWSWSTDFSLAEGYSVSDLDGQLGWLASGASVNAEEAALLISDENAPAELERFVGVGELQQVWLGFRAKLHPGPLPEPEDIAGPTAGMFGFSNEDKLQVFDPLAGEWIKISVDIDATEWNQYDAYLDYQTKRWMLAINGSLVVQDVPFVDENLTSFARFRALQTEAAEGETSQADFDQVRISSAEPAGLDFDGDGLDNELERSVGGDVWLEDTDGDGMLDAWEYQYGLNLAANDAGLDLDGDGLSNATELLLGFDPSVTDMDEDGWSDFDEYYAQTNAFDENEHPDAVGLPSPWQIVAVSGSGVPMAWQVGDSWRLAGAGSGDRGAYFHCDITSNFSLTFRVDSLETDEANAALALMVRESTSTSSPYISAEYRKNGRYYRRYRNPFNGDQDLFRREPDGVSVPGLYMRMQRMNTGTTVSFSNDGILWRDIVTSEESYPNADDTLIGLMLHADDSSDPDHYARASVELIDFRLDTDNDGLYDDEEVALGLNPLLADSDGDTVSDYEEVHYAHSDPLIPDLPEWTAFDSVAIQTAQADLGKWEMSVSNELFSSDIAGKITVNISLAEAGIYRLSVPIRYVFHGDENAYRPLIIHHYIDGEYVSSNEYVQSVSGQIDPLSVYLPHLAAGDHSYQLHWENVYEERWIGVGDIALERPESDTADWGEYYLDSTESLLTEVTQSAISPAFIEGTTAYLGKMSVSDGSTLRRAAGDGWYADIDLPADGSIHTFDLGFQEGGKTINQSIEWTVTDVLQSENIALRVGDALRLNAGQSPDGSLVSITVGADEYETTDTEPVIHTFTESGVYTVTALRSGVSGQFDVIVYPTQVQADDPALMRHYVREWTWEGLAGLVADGGDIGLTLISDNGNDSTFELSRSEVLRPRSLVARVGEGGAIAQSVSTEGFWIRENVSGFYQGSNLGEGIQEATSVLITSPLPDDISLRVSIFKSGVIFGDGTVVKWLTNDDLDAFGRCSLVMYKPDDVSGSVCHHVFVYEAGQYINRR
ncbi:hypothetical protein [Cerasicoccus frondis]|uniref:hypothetical protein n=1 Tax=Cerasicoccus frondis TaxID=490090 RepID=UPI0028529638|nr:hypothetical protein [Cerasicoccus frondis]